MSDTDPSEALREQVEAAIQILGSHGVVAIPTDTFYGLAACILEEAALERIFQIKRRPKGVALPLLLAGAGDLDMWAKDVPGVAWALADRFWPGALTLLLTRADAVPAAICGGRETVGLRVPDHWVPRHIARVLRAPITGTSANLTGSPAVTTAAAVRAEFGGEVDMIVDGGVTPGGPPSTVVDLTGRRPRILRAGAISESAIAAVCDHQVTV